MKKNFIVWKKVAIRIITEKYNANEIKLWFWVEKYENFFVF